MSKRKPAKAVVRRRVPVENLTRIEVAPGVFVYTNTAGAAVSLEWDKGDGVVTRVTLTT